MRKDTLCTLEVVRLDRDANTWTSDPISIYEDAVLLGKATVPPALLRSVVAHLVREPGDGAGLMEPLSGYGGAYQ